MDMCRTIDQGCFTHAVIVEEFHDCNDACVLLVWAMGGAYIANFARAFRLSFGIGSSITV